MPEATKYPVAEIRGKLGLTKRELADKLGLSPRTIDGWESAHPKRNPSKLAIKYMEQLSTQSGA